jgi:hypothetical protein
MGVKLVASSGGSVELVPTNTASNFTVTVPAGTGTVAVNGVSSSIVSGTAVASTSGTSIDFTGIPSWVKRITVMLSGVSVSGTSVVQVQLGTSSGVETTGYLTMIGLIATTSNTTRGTQYTSGFATVHSGAASDTWRGNIIFTLVGSNAWTGTGNFYNSIDGVVMSAGTKTTASTLDRVRITTANGTDTFDAGSINILYE